MKQILIVAGLGGLLLVAVYFFAEGNQGYWGMMSGQPGAYGMHNSNMMMNNHEAYIDNEKKFIELMIPHHEEAIRTAQEVLERGGTTEGMVTLAENIIALQTKEVEFMKTSYEDWFGQAYQSTGEYQPMMRELATYENETLDLIFLHDMTMHHMGAIRMSRMLKPYIEHESMGELTTNIIVNQTREIQTMQELYQEIRSTQ